MFKALKDIEINEELRYSYGPHKGKNPISRPWEENSVGAAEKSSIISAKENEQYKQASDKNTLAASSAEVVTDLTPHKDVGSREDEEKENGMIFSLII